MFPIVPPPGLKKRTYLHELVRQRELSSDTWNYLLPFVPGLSLVFLGRALEKRPTSHLIVLALVFVGLFLVTAWLGARSARKLQKEIDALDAS